MIEKRESGEQTAVEERVNGGSVEREREREERMPLFVNQSAVSERENFKNPQREEEDRRGVREEKREGWNTKRGGHL